MLVVNLIVKQSSSILTDMSIHNDDYWKGVLLIFPMLQKCTNLEKCEKSQKRDTSERNISNKNCGNCLRIVPKFFESMLFNKKCL